MTSGQPNADDRTGDRGARDARTSRPVGNRDLVRAFQLTAGDDAKVESLLARCSIFLRGAVVITQTNEWPCVRPVTEVWCRRADRQRVVAELVSLTEDGVARA
jgi:hypothetical protein